MDVTDSEGSAAKILNSKDLQPEGDFPRRVVRVYIAHALSSIGANLLIPCFFFYAKQIFHWGSRPCLEMVALEGIVYVVGALSANQLVARLGRKGALLGIQAALALASAVGCIWPNPVLVVAILLTYTLVSAAAWPIYESLISAGAAPRLLSRRIGVYNLVWSGLGTVMLAVTGVIVSGFPLGTFLFPLAAHLTALALLSAGNVEPPKQTGQPAQGPALTHPADALRRQRRLALWLSRLGLPATYTVLYSLVALMPSLKVIQSFSPVMQTVVASLWMAARFFTFAALGATLWWQTRPRLLLVAAIVMTFAFLGVTLLPAELLGGGIRSVTAFDQSWMIAWQIPLGVSMGLIYAGSLYFGMVLSEGSTEHGGYHEALIGIGQIIGPAAALAAEEVRPGDIRIAICAVTALLGLCLVAELFVTFGQSTVRQGAQSE